MPLKFVTILFVAAFVNCALSLCPVPTCAESSATGTDEPLHPHTDPYKFWQCAPAAVGFWQPVEKSCAVGGVVFSASKQQCVWVHEWDQTCQNYPTTTTSGPSTSTTKFPTTSFSTGSSSTTTQTPPVVNCCTPVNCHDSEVAKLPACPENADYREYYRECVDGLEVTQHCPHKPGGEQLVFNYYIQSCVHPKNFEEACH